MKKMATPVIIPEDREGLLRLLAEENETRRRSAKWLYGMLIFGGGFVLLSNLFLWIVKKEPPDFAGMSGLLALVGIGAGVTPRHKMAAETAARLGDPKMAGYLLEVLSSQDPKLIALAEESLTASLMKVGPREVEAFDAVQRKALFRQAAITKKADLAEACIHALRTVGDREAIATLEGIAEGESALKDAENERLATAARMALADIRMREAGKIIGPATLEAAIAQEVQEARLHIGSDPA